MVKTSWGLMLNVLLGVMVVAGCKVPTSPRMGGSGGSSSGATVAGSITVPGMFAMTKAQAIAELRRAGYAGDVHEDANACGSVVDGRVIELDQVCYQHPPAGRVQGTRLPITIRVQTENPWHGNAGKATEWHLMPDLAGMAVEQARAEMKRVGFDHRDRVQLMWVDEAGCAPLRVCRTYPAAMQRAGINSEAVVFAGRDPDAQPAVVPPLTSDSSSTSGPPAPAPAPVPPAPTEPTPEPFF